LSVAAGQGVFAADMPVKMPVDKIAPIASDWAGPMPRIIRSASAPTPPRSGSPTGSGPQHPGLAVKRPGRR